MMINNQNINAVREYTRVTIAAMAHVTYLLFSARYNSTLLSY